MPANPYLFRFINTTTIEVPSPIFHIYYNDHGYSGEFLRSAGVNNQIMDYNASYKTAHDLLADEENLDSRTFDYFINTGTADATDYSVGSAEIDATLVVIDDMSDPQDAGDDLIGNIGWWVEDVDTEGKCKKITLVVQFWYPGLEITKHDPEVIVLKSTFIRP